MSHDYEIEVGGKKLTIGTGEMAKQANGSVTVRLGDTMILAAAVAAPTASEGRDFFPLQIEYKEKYYASGRIPGGYVKREGRPGDHEVLTCRITDRPLRPLFPKDFLNEVQIAITVISSDKKEMADVLAIIGASAALSISGIPFHGPVAAVRVGRVEGSFVVNPTHQDLEQSDIDLMVAGTERAVTMIEGSSKNITEADMLAAVECAHDNIKIICGLQKQMIEKHAKPFMEYTPKEKNSELESVVKEKYYSDVEALMSIQVKQEREAAYNAIIEKAKSELQERYPDDLSEISTVIHDMDKDVVRKGILDGKRTDGRALDTVRPITIRTGVLPGSHGSALFTRGETQSLGVVTLGTEKDSMRVDSMNGDGNRHFFLHYNFPPYSVGECGRFGGTGRREIGHGMLAERALTYAIPDFKDFPYTVRIVSEILESNGSSSMASICSGSLALYDGGVKTKSPIAGIAMGLVLEDGRHAVLSDIQGLEDHLGDMDFKVAGTEEGITAFQLDIKIEGITSDIMREALEQARKGRLHILSEMSKSLSEPRAELRPNAPRIAEIKIPTDKIGELIGTGGKNIKGIIEATGSEINVSEDGTVKIYSSDQDILNSTKALVESSIAEVETMKIYEGTVKRIADFGAFVEILPGKEGLLHISKIDHKRIKQVTDVLQIGDKVKVKVMHVDKGGRMDLSRKDALPPEKE
ncbi:MAG: polyribonucleotide nucleotidyltransferase [Spirochaetes bacterium]|jgi:polyribonucleotide nucleotidyltransferase|nr:polyribonucleotide nucleotidyltransferase [Spirochaetota bacterium]